MGRRGRDKETGREVKRCSVVREAVAADWMVPHSHMVDKNQEGYLGSEQSQPQARPHNPEFQCQEDK